MNIIQNGDSERAYRHIYGIKRFECKICGCIWEVNRAEYTYTYDQRENFYEYTCRCPCCNVMAHMTAK